MFRKAFDFFIFSSLFIAVCAVLMVHQANHLLHLQYYRTPYLLFVFCSTICSYNFHWYLTPYAESEQLRARWMQKHNHYNLIFFFIGLAGCAVLFFYLIHHWFWLMGAVFLTFLYSAPKIPLPLFQHLKNVAIGKTIFLAFVWMYVTTLLPLFISSKVIHTPEILFCMSRFFLIYAICILFDYRDREQDKKEGIRSMITYFNERGVDLLFYLSWLTFVISTVVLYYYHFSLTVIILLLAPGAILIAIYQKAKTTFSDYVYYFALDGLMGFSSLLTLFLSI